MRRCRQARSVAVMTVPLNTVVRIAGYAWIGVVMFALYPTALPGGLPVQIAAYAAGGLAVAGWTVIDHYPPAARRRARWLPVPLGISAVAAGCAGPVGWGGLALMVFGFLAVMHVARECALAAALAVVLAGVLAAEVTALVFLRDYSSIYSYGAYIGFPVGFLCAFAMGRSLAARTAELLAQREQAEAERRRADLLDERARIAREIHDVLAHSLGALGIQVQAARSVMTDLGDIARADELLAGAEKMAAEGLTETRRALQALRTDMLPLGEELATAAASYAERYRVKVGVRTEGPPRPVPPDAAVALLRIAQEAVVNAAKHAAGQPVTICLAYEPEEVRLAVVNDLTGGTADQAPVSTADTGYGLTGMRERLRLLNGSLETGRRGGQWVVTAELPVPSP